jgi:hypothetical protein
MNFYRQYPHLEMSKCVRYKYHATNLILALLAFGLGLQIAPPNAQSNEPFSSGVIPPQAIVSWEKAVAPSHLANGSALTQDEGPTEDQLKTSLYAEEGFGNEQAYDQMMKTLLALAAVDPASAIDFALHQLKPPFQEQALAKVLPLWAKQNPQAAWDWVKTQKAEDSPLTGAVLKQVAEIQPDKAWQFATELAKTMPNDAAGFYVSAMNGMIAVGKYDDAAKLLNSAVLPSKSLDSPYGLTGFLVSEWATYQPDQAAAWILTLPQNSNESKQAIIALGQVWANIDPQQSIDFASQLPPSPERISMLTSAVNAWYASDPAQVSSWVSNIPKGPDYNQFAAAIALAPRIINSSPETSVAWAMDISDNDLKMDSLTKIYSYWLETENPNASNSLSQLPTDIRSNLLKRLNLPDLEKP